MNLPTKGLLKNIKDIQNSKYAALMPDLKEEKTQKFTTIVLTLVAMIFFGLFAINPTLSTIANLQKQLDDDKFVQQKLQDKINDLSVLQEKYSTIQTDLPYIYNAIPQKSDIPTLVGQLQALAQSTNLTLVNIQTYQVDVSNDLVSGKKYSSFVFSVSATGSYENMKLFVSRVVNIQRMIAIENIAITKTTITGVNNTNSAGLQLSIKGDAYFKQ